MTFKEWLADVKDKGLICERYLPLVDAARSRKQYMDAVLDTNGMAFLCDMSTCKYKLPYEIICEEFKAYLNGRYIHTSNKVSGSYTTTMYCGVELPSSISVNTTLTGLFNCNCQVDIPNNTICQLYVDNGSNIMVNVPLSSRCYVEVWGDGVVEFLGDGDIYIEHKDRYNV